MNTKSIKVTRFVSRNLYGETRKQEKSRLLKARINAVLQGKARNVSFGSGTTKEQKNMRINTLRKHNLSTKTPKYLDIYEK